MRLILDKFRLLFPYLPASARHFLTRFALASAVLAVLDVIALMLLASVLSTAVMGTAVSIPLLGVIPQRALPVLIVVLAAVVLAKSAFGVMLQWRATRHFADFETSIGSRLFASYINSPWVERISIDTPRVVQMTDWGVANIVSGFILPLTTLPGAIITAIGVVVVMFVQQPLTALITLGYLGLIALAQYLLLSPRVRRAAASARDSSLQLGSLLAGMMGALKEITLRGKEAEVSQVIHDIRARVSWARADSSFLGTVPRFIFDAAVIGGFLVVGGVAFAVGGTAGAINSVALFGIAGFRLVPSLTTFQAAMTQALTRAPYVDTIVGDIARVQHPSVAARADQLPLPPNPKLLALRNVGFRYPGANFAALRQVNIDIPIGSSVGIVGGSGAGKSTLVDILLGLLLPSEGKIAIDGEPLSAVLTAWRTRVGYVPQDVALFDGSIAQNVALTWSDDLDLARVERALRRAQLWSVVVERPGGLAERIGERGLALSGGQRQRLGIARALYTDPLVLVLDEATSALDNKTEAQVAEAIAELAGGVTVISVAHRLSTIRNSDMILFMRDGRVESSGTFDEVLAANPEFAHQAALAGLA